MQDYQTIDLPLNFCLLTEIYSGRKAIFNLQSVSEIKQKLT